MSDKGSGTYIIDENYMIVKFNDVAKEIYPSLEVGVKCHKALMSLDEPCEACPVKNNILGPKTYFDPIRKIYETVDAVKVDNLHALVFSTTGEREKFAKSLPKDESEFNKLYEQEYYDRLTGAYSLNGFVRKAEEIIKNSNKDFSIIYFNVKNFKAINQIVGYNGGDKLLIEGYNLLLNSSLKPLCIGRVLGDRFVCLVDNDDFDLKLLDKISSKNWEYDNKQLKIIIVSGVYKIKDKSILVSSMIDKACLAIEKIIDDYSTPYSIFNEKMQEEYVSAAIILSNFEKSLNNGDIVPFFQPVYDSKNCEIVGAEVLARWKTDDSYISPNLFVPVLEKSGYITRLDKHIFSSVIKTFEERYQEGKVILPLSINLSWMDLYNDDLKKFIIDTLKNTILPRGFIRFETTETHVNVLESMCKDFLAEIKSLGAKIFMDDYGTGYSSLELIPRYNFDCLKLDMSLTKKIRTDETTRVIIRTVIQMCHSLGIKVIAEGVENDEEIEFLISNECDYFQGFYFLKPMSEKDLFDTLEKKKENLDFQKEFFKKFKHLYLDDSLSYGLNEKVMSDALDSSDRYVVVCDPKTLELVYINKKAKEISGHPEQLFFGKKCHKFMSGLDEMCPYCPIKKMDGENEKYIEVKAGENIYGVNAKYISYKDRKLFLELGRDIKREKEIEINHKNEIKTIKNESEMLVKHIIEKYEKADYERRFDFLTGLRNRLDLFEKLQESLSIGQKIEVMYMIDVDDFKMFNDCFGHQEGDKILKRISIALKHYGLENNISFYRYGGEEILGIGGYSDKPYREIAKEIVELVSDLKIKRENNKIVTISLGYTTNNSRYEKMIDKADNAMYQAKKSGKNNFVCFEDLKKDF